MPYSIKASRAAYADIAGFRPLFQHSVHAQIRYEACHERNWADVYLLTIEGQRAGYGAVKGMENLEDRDTIFEFYLLPIFRQHAIRFFQKLIEATRACYVECQTNAPLLSAMAHACCSDLQPEMWLFEDDHITHHHLPGTRFRKRRPGEVVPWQPKDPGGYLLMMDGKIVAEGDFLLHYNPPFADLHMAVSPGYRNKGIGTYFVQELKRACYLAGRYPAARCQVENTASRETLLKAGMRICGEMRWGALNGGA